jgi:hypothetical protein
MRVRLHNEKLHSYSKNIMLRKSKRMRWERHVAFMRDIRNAYMFLVGKPEGKMPLRRIRCRWDNIKVTQRNWVVGGEWIYLAQDMDQWRLL